MKKKILSLLLCLVMILSLIPSSVFALDERKVAREGVDREKVELAKTVSQHKDEHGNFDGTYDIKIEAYANGYYKPVDIVLVVDQSGSMTQNSGTSGVTNLENLRKALNTFGGDISDIDKVNRLAIVGFAGNADNGYSNTELFVNGTEVTYNSSEGYTPVYSLDTSRTYYIQNGSNYREVEYQESGDYAGQWCYTTRSGCTTVYHPVVPKTSASDHTAGRVYFFMRNTGGNLPSVQQYKDALVPVRADDIGGFDPDLQAAVDNLSANGATYPQGALQMAVNILKNRDVKNDSIIVYFTDGCPGENSTSRSTTAINQSLGHIQTLVRDYGSKIYTIGLGIDSTTGNNYTKDFLQQVLTTAGEYTGGDITANKYYRFANDSDDLPSIFDTIYEDTIARNMAMTAEAELLETIDDVFELNGTPREAIKVSQVPCVGIDKVTGEKTWNDAGATKLYPLATDKVDVKCTDGKNISITGYDYASVDLTNPDPEATNAIFYDSKNYIHGNKLEAIINVRLKDADDSCWEGVPYGFNEICPTEKTNLLDVNDDPIFSMDDTWSDFEAAFKVPVHHLKLSVDNATASATGSVKYGKSFDAATGILPEGTDYTVTADYTPASGTTEGTYTNGSFNKSATVVKYGAEEKDVTLSSVIHYQAGDLTLTDPNKIIINVIGNQSTVKYDGQEHTLTLSDFTLELVDGDNTETLTTGDYSYSGTAPEKTGKNAGTYSLTLNAAKFTFNRTVAKAVEFHVLKDASVIIEKRKVVLASGSDMKKYDGDPLTNSDAWVVEREGLDGFAPGEGVDDAKYTFIGTQTEIGSSLNDFQYVLKSNTDASNYAISTEPGTLTVTSHDPTNGFTSNPSGLTLPYNGEDQVLGTPGMPMHGTIMYRLGETGTWSTSMPEAKDVDDYTIYYYIDGGDEYNDVASADDPMSFESSITPATISASADGFTGDYDGDPHSITVSVTTPASGYTVTYSTDPGATKTYVATNPTYTDVGTYTVYYKITADNYTDKTGSETVVISKANPTPTTPPTSGKDAPTVAEPDGAVYVYNGTARNLVKAGTTSDGTFYYKVTAADATAPATTATGWSNTIPTGTDAGNYTIWWYIKGDANHNDSTPAKITTQIKKAPLTVKANDKSISYGDAAANNGVDIKGYVNGETVSVLGGTLSYDYKDSALENDYTTSSPVGSYVIIPSGYTSKNYDITFENGVLTVGDATIVASPKGFTGTYDGQPHSITVTVTTPDSGYTVTYSTDPGATKVYGTTNPTYTDVGTYTVYYKVSAENYTDATGSATVVINKANPTLTTPPTSGKDAPTVAEPDGAVYVYNGTARDLVKEGTTSDGTFYYVVTAADATAPATTDSSWKTTVPTATDAGNYTIWWYIKGDANHNDSTPAKITTQIKKAPLTVTAKDKSISYGDAAANDGVDITGYVNSETVSVLGGTLTYAYKDSALVNTYTTSSPVGSYVIIPSGYTSKNYDITFKNGTLTVGKAPATPTTPPTSGKDAPTVAEPGGAVYVYNGLARNLVKAGTTSDGTFYYKVTAADAPQPATTATGWGNTIPTGTNAGDYTIWWYIKGDSNHSDSTPAKITTQIKKAPLTITAKDKSITFGDAAANAGVTPSGFKNGETIAVLGGTLTYAYKTKTAPIENYTTSSPVGTYAIIPSGYTSNNYNITFVNGTLTVGKASASATTPPLPGKDPATVAEPDGAVYVYNGQSRDLVFAGTTSDGTFYYAVTAADATAPATTDSSWKTTVPTGTNADTYTIWWYIKGDDNHNDSTPAKVTTQIKKAPLTIKANDHQITYGAAGANNGVTPTGFVNGETLAVLGGTLTYTYQTIEATPVPYTAGSPSGTYAIVPSGLTSSNYEITFTNGTLTVGDDVIVASAEGYTGTYDGAPHSITVTVTTPASGYTVCYGTDGINYTLTSNPTYTAVGTYTVYYKVTADNYTAATGSEQVVITKQSIPDPGDPTKPDSTMLIDWDEQTTDPWDDVNGDDVGDVENYIYDGAEKKPLIKVSFKGTPLEEGVDYTVSYLYNTDAGVAKVMINAASTGNFSGSFSKDFTIAPAKVTPVLSGQTAKPYDSNTSVVSTAFLNLTLDGVVEADKDDVSATAASYAFATATVGENKDVIASGIIISGDAAHNYVLTSDEATAPVGTITKKSEGGGGSSVYVPVVAKDTEKDPQTHTLYIKGYEDGSVRPNGNITRAETAMMFYRLLSGNSVKPYVAFADVDNSAWYAEAVKKLASMGIINGYEDGTFNPDGEITRAEFTAMAVRFVNSGTGASKTIFNDVPATYWASSVIATATSYGWITGYKDQSFRPDNAITRAEVATIINRMLSRHADEAYVRAHFGQLNHFSDLTDRSTWYFYDMVEATNTHRFNENNNKSETWIAK